jgi:hypothetical protein
VNFGDPPRRYPYITRRLYEQLLGVEPSIERTRVDLCDVRLAPHLATKRQTRDGGVDFVELPPDVAPDDVVDLTPHAGDRSQSLDHSGGYAWCLYELPPRD